MVCEKRDLRGKKEIKTGFHPIGEDILFTIKKWNRLE